MSIKLVVFAVGLSAVLFCKFGHAQVSGPLSGQLNQDGFLVITFTRRTSLAGIDLQSAAGNLIPVSNEVGAEPFTFFLTNTPNQITWGNLGSSVIFEPGDQFATSAGYNGDPTGDLRGFWGDGGIDEFPISVSDAINPVAPSNEIIPEPGTSLLAWSALIGPLAFRQRISSHASGLLK